MEGLSVNAHRRRARGISLIEALVALGVMAFGMMALLGLQSTLRGNADVARQRAEAVRIAQESIEDWRAFGAIETTAGVVDYAELVSDGPTDIAGVNATYARRRVVTASDSPPMKSLAVTVTWRDRTDEVQTVTLRTAIAAVPHELAGSLFIRPHGPPEGSTVRLPRGRHAGIPLSAKDLHPDLANKSVFKPPQAGGGPVAWVFDNRSGRITGVCAVASASTTESLAAADVVACSGNQSPELLLLSGFVRFASTAAPPDAAESEQPTASVLNLDIVLAGASCFDDAPDDAATAAARSAVAYHCAIAGTVWSGRSRVRPLGFGAGPAWAIAASGAGSFKVCRHTPLAGDSGPNASHALDYANVDAALIHQNFLVISAEHSCPTETPAADDPFNGNTRLHQNGVSPYDNP